ncbi:hypothetical protein IVN40_07085 [Chryseobacterium indologenes]|nr:hypothetical protein [Chryseobacterium indologenes]
MVTTLLSLRTVTSLFKKVVKLLLFIKETDYNINYSFIAPPLTPTALMSISG